MKKLAFIMSLAMLVSILAAPAYAARPGDEPSRTRDEDIRQELPDPNDPESPEYVVIDENGVPMGYIKIEDPDNPGQYLYVSEEDVGELDTPLVDNPGLPEETDPPEEDLTENDTPLVESPKTGERNADVLLVVAVMLCLAGVAMVGISKKKVTT